MSNEDIIRIACEAGWDVQNLEDGFGVRLKRFAQALDRKPLTDEEVQELIDSVDCLGVGQPTMYKVARAIEAAHGIK